MIHSQSWVYTGVKKNHSIKIIHNTDSGKVGIFLNNQPFTERQLSEGENEINVFIDDELCKINISPTGSNKYNYRFNVIRNSSSKPSIKRKARQKKQSRKVIYIICIFVLVALGTPISWFSFKYYLDEKELKEHGIRSTGKITFPSSFSTLSAHNLAYVYKVNGVKYFEELAISVSDKGYFMCENGMKLFPGDEFEVIYSSLNPHTSKILFDRPTSYQIRRYKDKCAAKFHDFIKEDMSEAEKLFLSECMVESVYEHYGIDGLAHIEFLDENHIVNFQHNSRTFANFMLKPKFVQSVSDCEEALDHIKVYIHF